jgi:hypothetical protein
VFHPTDTLHLLIYFGCPLSFVQSMDTLDLLNLIGYALSFVKWMDSLNLLIGTIEHALFLIVCRMYELSMRMYVLI